MHNPDNLIPTTVENPRQKQEREKIYEQIFVSTVNMKVLDDFESDLESVIDELGIVSTDIEDALEALNSYNSNDQKMILAIPHSIREKRFKALLTKIVKTNKKLDYNMFFKTLYDDAVANGFTMGYHISPAEISKQENDWSINATDFDDRDERKMAYYSLDHANLFRKKRGEYLYVVRAEIGENSSHKRDTNNNWGRANKLSIISKVPLDEIDKIVENTYQEKYKKAA